MPKTFLVGFYGSGRLFEGKSIHDIEENQKQKKLGNFMEMKDG